jgi:hypothetical protein
MGAARLGLLAGLSLADAKKVAPQPMRKPGVTRRDPA